MGISKEIEEATISSEEVKILRLKQRFKNLCNKYGLLTKCEVKMAGYWPSSFFGCLWTETSINLQKKKAANIQPS